MLFAAEAHWEYVSVSKVSSKFEPPHLLVLVEGLWITGGTSYEEWMYTHPPKNRELTLTHTSHQHSHTHIDTHTQSEGLKQTHTQKVRPGDRLTDTHSDINRQALRHPQTDSQTATDRHSDTNTEIEPHRHTEIHIKTHQTDSRPRTQI